MIRRRVRRLARTQRAEEDSAEPYSGINRISILVPRCHEMPLLWTHGLAIYARKAAACCLPSLQPPPRNNNRVSSAVPTSIDSELGPRVLQVRKG